MTTLINEPFGEETKTPTNTPIKSLTDAANIAEAIRKRCRAVVQGRDEIIDLILIALFADGHVLLEDYPGSGKTTLAKTLGESILDDLPEDHLPSFRRIQFTPDLLPSDITGVTIFDTESNSFRFLQGPIFAYVVLADEINRTSPKVQSALLEAMAEKQVTVDNKTHPLDDLFFVIATQNPLDLVGTYPLPLAQLDRFLFKIRMKHLTKEAELEVLSHWKKDPEPLKLPQVARRDIIASRLFIHHHVHVSKSIHECLVDIAQAIRADKRVLQGVSTRSIVLGILAFQSRAMLCGRDFVAAEDIEKLLIPLFCHRLDLVPGLKDPTPILQECAAPALERLARVTLKRY